MSSVVLYAGSEIFLCAVTVKWVSIPRNHSWQFFTSASCIDRSVQLWCL